MWDSFWRHLWFMVQCVVTATVMTISWYHLRSKGFRFAEIDGVDLVMVVTVIGGIFVMYGVSAAELMKSFNEKTATMSMALCKEDYDTMIALRDERLPIVQHLFQNTMGLIIVVLIGLVDYHSRYVGGTLVFVASLVTIMYLLASMRLQDPLKAAWFRERTPSIVLDADVDEYFRIGQRTESQVMLRPRHQESRRSRRRRMIKRK